MARRLPRTLALAPLVALPAVADAPYRFAWVPERALGDTGLPLACLGMGIVFAALFALWGFLVAMPSLLAPFERWVPTHAPTPAHAAPPADTAPEQLAAAIACAAHAARAG